MPFPRDITAEDQGQMQRSVLSGTVVGVLAGVSLFLLLLYLLYRRYRDCINMHMYIRKTKSRGVLPGPRIPTGEAIPRSVFTPEPPPPYTIYDTSPSLMSSASTISPESYQDVGLQYYPRSHGSSMDSFVSYGEAQVVELALPPPILQAITPLSPFGDFDTVREQVEISQNRRDAYEKLNGEVKVVRKPVRAWV